MNCSKLSMDKKKAALILPTYIETNGKVAELMKMMDDPKVRIEYARLVKELQANPETVAQKLREATWEKKSVRDILAELD